MSREMLKDCIAAHVKSGHHGLAITAMEGETIAGIDVYPDWIKEYKELPFEEFAKMILEPAFASLVAHLEYPVQSVIVERPVRKRKKGR